MTAAAEVTPEPEPEARPQPRPIPVTVRKRERSRLAKAELWMHAAAWAENHARQVEGSGAGMLPFDQWPEDDPMRQLCITYALTPADVARLLRSIGAELENRAMRAGYEQAWV